MPITWLEEGHLAGAAYPNADEALRELADAGVTVLVNLHGRGHQAERLAAHGMTEVHLPVTDFSAPSPTQLDQGVAAIKQGLDAGTGVVVHCAYGLGRTGTLLACYLVSTGLEPDEAISRVRQARPGSIETATQEAAVRTYAERRRS
jgi:atypical dual specificity phosphatase